MSKGGMGRGIAHRGALPPIVLLFSCKEAAKYLHEDNEVLAAVYGQAPIRIDLAVSTVPGGAYIYPRLESNQFKLLQQYPRLSLVKLREWIENGKLKGEVRNRINNALVNAFDDRPAACSILEQVRAVILTDGLTEQDSLLKDVFAGDYLPNAAIFKLRYPGRGKPERIWRKNPADVPLEDWPMCQTCKRKMRPAGYLFVCERCSNTADVDGNPVQPQSKSANAPQPDCPDCKSPGQDQGNGTFKCPECLRVWSSEPNNAPLCMTCGTKMRPAGSGFVCESCGTTKGFD